MLRKNFISLKTTMTALVVTSLLSHAESNSVNPFAINNGNLPSQKEYGGPLFQFNYDYPTTYKRPINMPWHKVLNGKPLNKDKAHDYIMALKEHVSKSVRPFILAPKKWNATSQKGWYSMLWAGEEVSKTGWEGRDAIYGTYTGQIIAKEVYKESGLTVDIRNHAGIYYDERAAHTLHKVWQECNDTKQECVPSLNNGEAQFQEGSIIIKAAGVTATPEEWPILEGAAKWQIYRKAFDINGTIVNSKPKVTDLRLGIFDIIIKDSIASPQTGWVFTTLVYDKDAKGDNAWDKMVPLGATWGNDPDINSAKYPEKELSETYVNPHAPSWSTVTLGYGKRLSGPFDIAVKYNVEVNGTEVKSLRSSSCLSCHGTVSYVPNSYKMNTFFYPGKPSKIEPWKMYVPGSKKWNEWFQNRDGSETQSNKKEAIALDYSTFLEAVLMNYTAATLVESKQNNDMLLKYKMYRQNRQH